MAVDVRILGAGDHAVLDNVAPDVFDYDVDSRLVVEFLGNDRHHVAVAVDNGQVVGFASGVHYIHPDKPAELWINEVGVAPTHREQGIGRAVVRALLIHGQRVGCREAWVLTERSNTVAQRLYESAGGERAKDDPVMFTFSLGASEERVSVTPGQRLVE